MSKEKMRPHKEHDAEKPRFDISISKQGNEEVLRITHPDWKEEQTFESHFPAGGVQLFDSKTGKAKEYLTTEEIKNLYERFLREGASYESLVKKHDLRSLIDFFNMPEKEREKHL